MQTVELAEGAEQSAFAQMMAELIRQNLADHPHKQRDFARMRGRVALIATDAQITITLRFQAGSLKVHSGYHGIPDLIVRGPSAALIDLSRLPPHPTLRFLPDFRSDVAHSLARALFERKLRIGGLTSHPRLAYGLSQVLSIH
jgi:hypothetical protein